jgi:secreted Zn-dependent insulinase-like peptidase
MPSRNRTFFLAILLAIAFSFFKSTFNAQPIVSDNDEKQYRYLELDNDLKVLLISDPKADRAAASLDVHAGSLQDPALRPGLAHFLEHMLFLGTKTYPVAGEYQAFISQHGGSHNAFTAQEHTNYFFEIDAKKLHGALDRFSRFFHEPLFTEEYVQREKEAVNGEYKSKYKDDYRRIQYVMKTLVNKDHPASHFATGNLQTLSDNEHSKVRDDLLAFYKKYYSSNLMTLTVYGKEDLDTLKKWVTPLFDPIENNATQLEDYPESLYPELPMDVQIQPVKDIYRLSFTFPFNQSLDFYKKKPTQYIGHFLGHEGEGSLLAWLKAKGWAEGLSAGMHSRIRNNGAFQVNVSLTQQGLQHTDEISEQLFAYIQVLQKEGVQQWVFDELQQLSKMQFAFQQGQRPSGLVQGLSMNMHDYEVKDLLRGPYLWQEFDEKLIHKLLSKLTPLNVIRTLVSPTVQSDNQEKWFGAPFHSETLSAQKVKEWQSPTLAEGLHVPSPNPFIAQDVSLLEKGNQPLPELISQQAGLDVWHMQDLEFTAPQSSVYVNLRSPLPQISPSNQVLIDAWVSLLNDHLNSFSYPALLAGQHYSLYSHMRGLGIRLYGYRDKQDVVLEKVIKEMLAFEPNEQQWLQTQQELIRAYQNALKQKPYERTIAQLNQTLLQPNFSEAQLLAAVKSSVREDVLNIKQQFFKQLHAVILGHGNISKNQLLKSSQLLSNIIDNSEHIQVGRKQVKQLAHKVTKQTVIAEHADNAMTLYFQAQTQSSKERATMGLIAQIIKAPYYTLMRTQRKHGYIVFGTAYPMLEQGGLAFIVQSPSTLSQTLFDETQAFITDFIQTLENMPNEEYAAHQQGLIANLVKKPLNLKEKTNRYWRDIDIDNEQFNTYQELAKHVEKLTKQELVQYLKTYFISDEKKALLLNFDGSVQP